jgi:hypothetical protein
LPLARSSRGSCSTAPDVIATVKTHERCTCFGGDFTTGIHDSGDVYLLSRVLHDGDDQQCGDILKRCVKSIPPRA